MKKVHNTVFQRPKNTPPARGGMMMVLGALFFVCIGGALSFSSALFQPMSIPEPVKITVMPGERIRFLARRLKEEGVIRSAFFFEALYAFRFADRSLKAGDYTLSGAPTLFDTAMLFVQGMPREEIEITIIEGWTIYDIATYLKRIGYRSADDFIMATKDDFYDRFAFLPSIREGSNLEGYLFPDTYRIYVDSPTEDIILKMLENFQSKYSPAMVEETLKRKQDIHSIVTLASIIEREVVGDRDRRLIADIFYRRLARGMPLQADSTINYITGKSDLQARAADLRVDSPYNTYRNKGLPPGPIGNPGLSALQAALSPIENPFWFFLTTPRGEVIYSKTFGEHVKNKLKYLQR